MRAALSHCGQQARQHDYDRFLAALFVPPDAREALLALVAIDAELAHIRAMISEDMIGHMRHAWWQESIAGLYTGAGAKGHPVLQALLPVIAIIPEATLMPLLDSYRQYYPETPPDIDAKLDAMSLALLRSLSPGTEASWQKANALIARHRKKHGKGWNGWLNIKLLIAGM